MQCPICNKSACDSCGSCKCGWDYWGNEKWISVKERLPEEDGNCLAYWRDHNSNATFIAECLYQKSHGFTFARNRNSVIQRMHYFT